MYKEYMQNLLGMQINSCNCLPQDSYMAVNNTEQLKNMYPEIYKIIYPMVKKACLQPTYPITEESLNVMTEEVYSNIGTDSGSLEDLIKILLIRELINKPEQRIHSMQKPMHSMYNPFICSNI